MNQHRYFSTFLCSILVSFLLFGCSSTYYATMEKAGVHKRDILVDRVGDARDSQKEAQVQFKDALEQFGSVVKLKDTNLKKAYEKLDKEYRDCEKAAQDVSHRIDKIEDVAEALFDEWADELKEYENKSLRDSSKKQLKETKVRYKEMLQTMKSAEKSMDPVLKTFHDNVLFLKHNLNAQAIGSLQSEFSSLEEDIDGLIEKMNSAIEQSNTFIAQMKG